VDGILGADVIRRFVTTVDYQRQTVIFGRPTVEVPRPPAAEVENASATAKGNRIVLPFMLRDGWIMVRTRVAGGGGEAYDEEMILDTGAALTTFSRARARRLNFDLSGAKPTTMVLPIGRLSYLPHRLREIEFAGVKFNDSASVVVATREGLFTAGTDASLLGANVLRHFRLTIDYGRRQLTLDRVTDEVGEPDEYTSVGVLPKLRDGRYYVSGVVSGSPADDEGVEIGDEIMALGGRAIEDYSFSELVDALRGPEQSELAVTLRRGQRTIELELKRVKLL
jgi:membrane-associated protease RseP (regulator of RpoE activity)